MEGDQAQGRTHAGVDVVRELDLEAPTAIAGLELVTEVDGVAPVAVMAVDIRVADPEAVLGEPLEPHADQRTPTPSR